MNIRAIVILATAALTATAFMHESAAADLFSRPISHAPGNCQPALPVFDGNIRKRPLAVANEGTANAFVTCAFTTDGTALGVIEYQTAVQNQNPSGSPITIACTAVAGTASTAQYYSKNVSLTPGARATLAWLAADNGNQLYPHPVALSCLLPPGAALNENSALYVLQIP